MNNFYPYEKVIMDCQKAYRNLSAFLDKSLPPTIQVQVGEHLESCPECRKRLNVFERILNVSPELNNLQAPDNLEEIVLSAVDRYEAKRRKREAFKFREGARPRWMLGFSLAISSAIILIGLVFSSNLLTPHTQLANNSANSVNGNMTAFDKSDLVLDSPGDIIKVVQDLHGDRYIMVRSEAPFYKSSEMARNTINSSSRSSSTSAENPYLVKTGAEIVF